MHTGILKLMLAYTDMAVGPLLMVLNKEILDTVVSQNPKVDIAFDISTPSSKAQRYVGSAGKAICCWSGHLDFNFFICTPHLHFPTPS